MRIRLRTLSAWAATALMAFAFLGCGGDDDGDGGGGTSLKGTVGNLLDPTQTVAGIVVGSSSGARGVSGVDGSFSLPDVVAPYDILAIVPTTAAGSHIFSGYLGGTFANPRLGAVPIGFNSPSPKMGAPDLLRLRVSEKTYSQDAAEVDVSYSGNDLAGSSYYVVLSDGVRSNRRFVSASATSSNGIVRNWSRAPLHTINVAALQLDSGGNFRYGRSNGVVLAQNSTGNAVSITLSPVAGGFSTIGVSISAPASLSFTSVSWTAYTVVGGIPMEASDASGATTSLKIPNITGATHVVVVSARLENGSGEDLGGYLETRPGVAGGSTLTLNAVAPPSISSPADGAVNQPLDPTLDFTHSPGATAGLLQVYGSDPYGDIPQTWIFHVPGSASSVDLPSLPQVDARLHTSSQYAWGMISLVDGWEDLDMGNFLQVFNSLYGPEANIPLGLARTRSAALGPEFTFTTGIN